MNNLELEQKILSLRNELAVRSNEQELAERRVHALCKENMQLYQNNVEMKSDKQRLETELSNQKEKNSQELIHLGYLLNGSVASNTFSN